MAVPRDGKRNVKHADADDDDEQPTAEVERLKRIEENKQRMIELGMLKAKDNLLAAVSKAKGQPKPIKPAAPRRTQYVEVELRRSSRSQGKPAPCYRDADVFESLPREEKPAKSRAAVRCLVRVREPREPGTVPHRGGWHPGMGTASLQAEQQAAAEAQKKADQINSNGGVAAVKEMTASQVSGGFWSQLPLDFAKAFQFRPGEKRDIALLLGKEEHRVVFLAKKDGGGVGLSGGWRGFAILQELFPGDYVLYVKVDENNIKVELFRAYDYDAPFKQQYLAQKATGVYTAGGQEDEVREAAAGEGQEQQDEQERSEEAVERQGMQEGAEAAGEHSEAQQSEGTAGAGQGLWEEEQGARSNAKSGVAEGDDCAPGRKTAADVQREEGAGTKRSARVARHAGKEPRAKTAVEGKRQVAQGSSGKRNRQEKGAEAEGGNGKRVKTTSGRAKAALKTKQLPPKDGKDEFYVEAVVDYLCEDGVDWFKIRWETYGPEHDLWQLADSLSEPPETYRWDCKRPKRFQDPDEKRAATNKAWHKATSGGKGRGKAAAGK